MTFSRGIEETPTAICITNEKCVFEYVNNAFSKVFGYSNELIGKDYWTISPGKHSSQFQNILTTLKPGITKFTGEWMGLSKDGKLLVFYQIHCILRGRWFTEKSYIF
ncbi:PAS domain-containing protein [Anaerobacillus sp. HL2]|nr:PAS domain-containing protein [Anaerobacillus sp. HL2]